MEILPSLHYMRNLSPLQVFPPQFSRGLQFQTVKCSNRNHLTQCRGNNKTTQQQQPQLHLWIFLCNCTIPTGPVCHNWSSNVGAVQLVRREKYGQVLILARSIDSIVWYTRLTSSLSAAQKPYSTPKSHLLVGHVIRTIISMERRIALDLRPGRMAV